MQSQFNWSQFNPADYVPTKVQRVLTKSIGAQILQSNKTVKNHPACHYVVKSQDRLSEAELAEVKGLWSPLEIATKWATLPGDENVVGVEAGVEQIKRTNACVTITASSLVQSLSVVDKEGKATAYSISEAMPIIGGHVSLYMIHKTATLYFLANPPFRSGESVSSPIEDATSPQMYVPSGVAPVRRFNGKTYEGPFEDIYIPTPPPTIPKIEAVLNAVEEGRRAEVVDAVDRILAKLYHSSAHKHHHVFPEATPLIQRCTKMAALKSNMDFTGYWVQMKYFEKFARVSSVFEPFQCCVLGGGDAHRVMLAQELKFILNQTKILGVRSSSNSTTWTDLKSIAAFNFAICDMYSNVTPQLMTTGQVKPGTWGEFGPTIEIADLPGQLGVVIQKNLPVFSPASPSAAVQTFENLVRARNINTAYHTYGLVAFYHPTLWECKNWGIYPWDLNSGRVLMVLDREGMPREKLFGHLVRYWVGRMFFPYTRVTWPQIRGYFEAEPIIIKNGTRKVSAQSYTFEYDGDEVYGEVSEDKILEALALLPKQYVPYVSGVPMPEMPKLPAKVMLPQSPSPSPQSPPVELPAPTMSWGNFAFEEADDVEIKKEQEERRILMAAQAAALKKLMEDQAAAEKDKQVPEKQPEKKPESSSSSSGASKGGTGQGAQTKKGGNGGNAGAGRGGRKRK